MRSNTFLIYGHSGWNGKEAAIRKANENWRLAAIHVPGTVFTSSSCFFVALIVFLRLLVIKHPLSYHTAHDKIGRIGSIAIWSFALLVNLCPLIVSIPPIFEIPLYGNTYILAIRISYSFPILLTLLIYGLLLRALKQEIQEIDVNGSMNRIKENLAKMIQGIVLFVVICNVPYVAWFEYLFAMLNKGRASEIWNTNSGVQIIEYYMDRTVAMYKLH